MLEHVQKKFAQMGARLKVRTSKRRFETLRGDFAIDIQSDKEGEYFDLLVGNKDVDFEVIDLKAKDRHLLLHAEGADKTKYLCGHDERHWFVAGVNTSAGSVKKAKDLLKPQEVRQSQSKKRVKSKNIDKRKNKGFIRQGEWFFLPVDTLQVDVKLILKSEPLQRGRGRPHIAEELYRVGGETVHVHPRHAPNGLTPAQYGNLSDQRRKSPGWRVMRRNPSAYVRGKIRHPDHKTINLKFWHKVVPNNETQSRNVAFLD